MRVNAVVSNQPAGLLDCLAWQDAYEFEVDSFNLLELTGFACGHTSGAATGGAPTTA